MPAEAGIQYGVNSRMINTVTEYWIIRFRG
jgi:hypothetical protein